jgi:wyosine [tRNA(Phe)-imidazoG37] synthetase (radical SAM superfamily)
LGEIEQRTSDRQVFIPTAQVVADLQAFAPWTVDTITLSGSGEPTLALNLGEILLAVKTITQRSVGVLTNGSLLINPEVQANLKSADWVAVKVDATAVDAFCRINRPTPDLDLMQIWMGIYRFRQVYEGHLAIQTMVLTPWSESEQVFYIKLMQTLSPDEIQLNTPTRPRPLVHELEARENHTSTHLPYPGRTLRVVDPEHLHQFSDRIESTLNIPVKCPPFVLR